MEKRKIILVFAALIVAYVVSAVYANYVYNMNVASIIADGKARYPDHPDLVNYIHFAPFWETSSGLALRITGASMIFFSIGVYIWIDLRKAPKAASGNEAGGQKRKNAVGLAIILSMALLLSLFVVSAAQAPAQVQRTPARIMDAPLEPITVNTLLFFDEECTNQGDRKYRYDVTFTYRDTLQPFDRALDPWWGFNGTFSINFTCINGYNTFWSSNNGQHDTLVLLQDAIQQCGGTWDATNHWWYWQPSEQLGPDGRYYQVDFLLFFCNQQGMSDPALGLSVPYWNAGLISMGADRLVIRHELSHQFYCPHCGSLFCVMNPDVSGYAWCGSCKAFITEHREKWGYKQWLFVRSGVGGTTSPSSGTYHQKVRGTEVTITAFPQATPQYAFNQWAFAASPPVNITSNPYTFTVNADTEAQAQFIRIFQLTVIANITQGTTDPPPGGDYHYTRGTNVSISASANPGYYLGGWIIVDPHTIVPCGILTLTVPETVYVTMTSDLQVQPIFYPDPSDPESGSCGGPSRMPLIC